MRSYEVQVTRSYSAVVTVEAASADEALEKVDRRDFPLPDLDTWSGHKDWEYEVLNDDPASAEAYAIQAAEDAALQRRESSCYPLDR